MTRTEAKELLLNISAYDIDTQRGMAKQEAIEMAIQALEQKSCEYKPLVIDKLKDEDMQKLLREFKNQQVLAVNNDRLPSVTIIKPCDDTISRKDMLDAIGHGTTYTSEELQKIINGLPDAKMMLISMIKSELDNLDTYTIHMGVSQQDKVCVEFKEVVKILGKYRNEAERCK